MNKTEYENLINEKLASVKEELMQDFKEEKEIKLPDLGATYYFIDGSGEVRKGTWYDDAIDGRRFSIGNCFETREEAEFEAERLKVIAELKRFAEPKDRAWDGNTNHWYFYYDIDGSFEYDFSYIVTHHTIYFSSEEDARKAVETVGEDRIRRFYLGVEE